MKKGRPTLFTKEKIRRLEEAFSNGATDSEACYIADISINSLFEYQRQNPEFIERKNGLREMIEYQAKVNVAKKIQEGDINVSFRYLERKVKRASEPDSNFEQGVRGGGKLDISKEQMILIAKRFLKENQGQK